MAASACLTGLWELRPCTAAKLSYLCIGAEALLLATELRILIIAAKCAINQERRFFDRRSAHGKECRQNPPMPRGEGLLLARDRGPAHCEFVSDVGANFPPSGARAAIGARLGHCGHWACAVAAAPKSTRLGARGR